MRWFGAFLGFVLCLNSIQASAQEVDFADLARSVGISEVRAGLFFHDVELSGGVPFALKYEDIDLGKWQNFSAEVIFDLPDADMVRWLGSPRIGLSTMLNFSGKESYARLAALWQVPIFETGIFVEPMLGGVIHNGYLANAPVGQRDLGCRFLYFYGANIGYEINEKLSAMVSVEHASHWAHCSPTENDGINRLGLKLGWKFD